MLFFMASHLTCRDGIYYFRARVPSHLVSAYGRSIVSVSLKTRDPQEAKARARARRVELDNALRSLEQGSTPPDPESGGSVLFLSDADIEAFCNQFVADILAADELERIKGLSPLDHQMSVDIWSSVLPRMKSDFARGVVSELVLDELSMQMKARRLVLPKSSPSFGRLAIAFQQAQLRGYEARLRRLHGEEVPLLLIST